MWEGFAWSVQTRGVHKEAKMKAKQRMVSALVCCGWSVLLTELSCKNVNYIGSYAVSICSDDYPSCIYMMYSLKHYTSMAHHEKGLCLRTNAEWDTCQVEQRVCSTLTTHRFTHLCRFFKFNHGRGCWPTKPQNFLYCLISVC